jgi:heme-degrading monooxygenase HmoA
VREKLPAAGATAVIFVSLRTSEDDVGYAQAAEQMVRRAAVFPGYLGSDSARGADGLGITVSYWADAQSALAWKADAEHAAIRQIGRERWYAHYRLVVSTVDRAYAWSRPASGPA